MTNLLVPTDFTPGSLKLAAQAINVLNRPVNVFLFHAFDMPFFFQDMIRPDQQPWQELMNDRFRQGCKQMKEMYPNLIGKIKPLYMIGNTNVLFRNLAEANDIHIIACPAGYQYQKIHPRSVNPVPLFRKSRIALLQEFSLREWNVYEKRTAKVAYDVVAAS